MKLEDFQLETARIVNENTKTLINSFDATNATDESKGGLYLHFTETEMSYSYISETHNKVLFDKLPDFMIDKIKNNSTDKIYVVCGGIKDYFAAYWLDKKI